MLEVEYIMLCTSNTSNTDLRNDILSPLVHEKIYIEIINDSYR